MKSNAVAAGFAFGFIRVFPIAAFASELVLGTTEFFFDASALLFERHSKVGCKYQDLRTQSCSEFRCRRRRPSERPFHHILAIRRASSGRRRLAIPRATEQQLLLVELLTEGTERLDSCHARDCKAALMTTPHASHAPHGAGKTLPLRYRFGELIIILMIRLREYAFIATSILQSCSIARPFLNRRPITVVLLGAQVA